MSFTAEVKQEVAQKELRECDARAQLSALIQMTSSLALSSQGMSILVRVENPTVAKKIYSLTKSRYSVDIDLSVQRKMNLRKNNIYCLRILSRTTEILKDLGIYSARGLLEKPLAKITQKDCCARAYLAGAFMAGGSVNSPQKTSYHLEVKANSLAHAEFLIRLMERFDIPARHIERRSRQIVYVKSAEKIGDFLKCIDASDSLLKFEDIRISRDFMNSLTRTANMDIANEVKSQTAAKAQLEDIEVLEQNGRMRYLDEKLMEIVLLRRENPEASLKELGEIYERQTGTKVSKSGLKHRFIRIHDLAEKERSR